MEEKPIHHHTALLLILASVGICMIFVSQLIETLPLQKELSASIHTSLGQVSTAIDQVKTRISTIPPETNRLRNLFRLQPFRELRIQARTISPIRQNLPAPKQITDIVQAIPAKKPVEVFTPSQSLPDRAVIQLLCRIPSDKGVKFISSSGVIISQSGIILTNAHVGVQPFLDTFTQSPVSCSARHGSPALQPISVELLYISPQWTAKHKGEISGVFSSDTGEYDIAILKTSENINAAELAIAPLQGIHGGIFDLYHGINNDSALKIREQVKIIAYPITGNPSQLVRKSEDLTIEDMYNITGGNLILTSASQVGKAGASGGPIFNSNNILVALASNVIPSQNGNKIHAIDLAHINQTLISDTGLSLHEIIHSDGEKLKQTFKANLKNTVLNHLIR